MNIPWGVLGILIVIAILLNRMVNTPNWGLGRETSLEFWAQIWRGR